MALPPDWTHGTVSANGIDLQYYRVGSGPSIVLVHGFGDTGRRWVPLADELAAEYDVITYDARGHGRSDAPETGYGISDRVADLRGLIHELDVERPILLGHSIGGGTVGWLAARHPELPRGVILVDPDCVHELPDRDPEKLFEESRQRLRNGHEQTVEEIVGEQYPEMDSAHARRLATGHLESSLEIAELGREGYPTPLAEKFPDITSQTLLLRSDRDIEERAKDLDAAESLQSGRVVHVPEAGHYVIRDRFDAAYKEIRTFLRRVDP